MQGTPFFEPAIMPTPSLDHSRLALVLQGGGARGAYHVGALKAIAEITQARRSPFHIVCGASVGAINAASIAVATHDFQNGVAHLEGLWRSLRTQTIFDARALPLLGTSLRWAMTPVLARFGYPTTGGFLDYGPLCRMLEQEFNRDHLRSAIRSGALHALSITASSYEDGDAVTFFEGAREIEDWQRARRRGTRVRIGPEHILASAALPFAFAPVRLEDGFYGDGSLRLTSPLSPAIHLGADRVLVITTRDGTLGPVGRKRGATSPSIGEIAGHALDIIFNDSLEADHERLLRVNHTISLLSPEARAQHTLKAIDTHLLRPSQDIRDQARAHARELPLPLRVLLRSLGTANSDGRIESYLMFEPGYVGALIDMGYADTMADAAAVRALLAP